MPDEGCEIQQNDHLVTRSGTSDAEHVIRDVAAQDGGRHLAARFRRQGAKWEPGKFGLSTHRLKISSLICQATARRA